MKKYLVILFLLSFSSVKISAQENNNVTQQVNGLIKEGIEHHDAKEYDMAIENYKKALEIEPNSMVAIYELSLSYLAMKDYKNAFQYSSKVIESNDKSLWANAYGVKSEVLAETGKVDEAIVLLEEAIRNVGSDYYLHFNLALNYFSQGNLENTIKNVDRALDISKSQSGAYLLSAYALNDTDLWVQSILAFHIFLLMEPDSHRSKNAFEEMLQVMNVKESTEKPIERSFIQQQLQRNVSTRNKEGPPISLVDGLDRELIYKSIKTAKDSLLNTTKDTIINDSLSNALYETFREVTRAFYTALDQENDGTKTGIVWSFYVPIVTKILHSNFFETYCRYISLAYFPESYKWWEDNQETAEKFALWFEKGDEE